jgi:cytochrome b subunit of formate dehydrogenase
MISDSFALYTLCFSLFCIPTAAQSIYSYCTCFLFHLASLSHFLQACNFIASTDFLHFFYIFYMRLCQYTTNLDAFPGCVHIFITLLHAYLAFSTVFAAIEKVFHCWQPVCAMYVHIHSCMRRERLVRE